MGAPRPVLFVPLTAVRRAAYGDHVYLLVDIMTHGGGLQSINRHGINRGDTGPLAKCSFEETTDMLTNAGMFAEKDSANGVSAAIMLGQVPLGGTGGVAPILDESMLTKNVVVSHPDIEKEMFGRVDREDMCRRILKFSPLDLDSDDGVFNAQQPPTPVIIT